MRVIDFIKNHSASETDFIRTLKSLSAQYSQTLELLRAACLNQVPEQELLTSFFLQEIELDENGKYKLAGGANHREIMRRIVKKYGRQHWLAREQELSKSN
ncbi:hypothetical protein LJC42_07475 [Eubacteriales bacterium OttesenSCG-928-K08]|nr:hypothetical protein [Eubacteriales bacterium OttesenSCG-928-K08]